MTKEHEEATREFAVGLDELRIMRGHLELHLADINGILNRMEGFRGKVIVDGGKRVWEAIVYTEDEKGRRKPSRIGSWLEKVKSAYVASPEHEEKILGGEQHKQK